MTKHPSGLARQQAERADAIQTLCRLRREAREEIARLIRFLDQSDPYVMNELEDDDEREPVGDEEPSLGGFDRMTDQTKSYCQRRSIFGGDAERDEAESGIGDEDGLREQLGHQIL